MFQGFTQREFDIFEIPGYAARMPRLRAEITPRLKELAALLAPRLESALGIEMHPHVALHMRRTVNPPEETWVAFCRATRAYKPYVHFRAAINGGGMKMSVFLEDDADDKPTFAKGLKRNSSALVKMFAATPNIHSYDLLTESGGPRPAHTLSKKEIEAFADRLAAVKGQHASFAIPISRKNPALSTAEGVTSAAEHSMTILLPLYRLGMDSTYKL